MAHLVILCARLPKLLAPPSLTKKGKRIIKINDLPVSVVKEMLKYAYTGQAYVEFDSVSVYKDILDKYNPNFFQRCSWEDNPFATTFFNYETDSLLWHLKGVVIKSNLRRDRIKLLRFHPIELELSLDILESEDEKKGLTLTFKFCCEEMPKSTIFSCKYSLINEDSKEIFELGETETLLRSNKTQGKLKLCSLLELMRGKAILCAREEFLILRTDFKFCYGSSKSFIQNLYEGQFEISRCTSCALLSADMEHLHRFVGFTDIMVENGDGIKIPAHKAILFARLAEAEKLNVKENNSIVIEGYDFQGLYNFLRQLYTGNASM
ncbi:hypothetical protein AVEN_241389-1 [Araneus ventricosus]|uniref:BTB domain-containing protein n=1 Tax=Araneus ventricosus TaxID=182803 RepID=A0A4Y2S6D8_ARAVE|nr:hypothetical protein AVEN_241389-1 [Araneus ventricosus]